MKQWRCTVCEYIHKADAPPESCSVCGSESSLFVTAGEEKQPTAPRPTAADETLRWQCVVCGYIHTGPEPPEKCPVCGADRSQFICLDREAEEDASPAAGTTPAGPDRKWRCTLCGYIHTGPEPPEICPVCGADRSLFEEVMEEETAARSPEPRVAPQAAADDTAAADADGKITAAGIVSKINARLDPHRGLIDFAIENHAHPIAVHVPNGVLPIAVVMVTLAALFDMPAMGLAGFYNVLFILFSMPAVLFTGYLHWQYKFGGHMTSLFRAKLISAAMVSVLALIIVIWGFVDPQVAEAPTFTYILVHLVTLGVAAYAGYLGGRLVFHRAG